MLLIIRDSVLGSQVVKCPMRRSSRVDDIEIPIQQCSKNCRHFKGYKSVYEHRLLMCKYYYHQSQKED